MGEGIDIEKLKGCPVIDPLEEIKYKCDAIHSENMLIIDHISKLMDKISIIEEKLEEMSAENVYEKFKSSWDLVSSQDEKFMDNSIRLLKLQTEK
jgi:hypothetical protein